MEPHAPLGTWKAVILGQMVGVTVEMSWEGVWTTDGHNTSFSFFCVVFVGGGVKATYLISNPTPCHCNLSNLHNNQT